MEVRKECSYLLAAVYVMLFVSRHGTLGQLPVPCTDLRPVYLLHIIASDLYRLPLGMEVIYDNKVGIHAYRFTKRANRMNFPSPVIFTFCSYFPEEFSLLATLKVGQRTSKSEECIVSLIPRGTTDIKLGLRLYFGKLQFDFFDRLTMRRRIVEFKHMGIFNNKWHTIIISVTGDRVILRTDCGKRKTKKLRRIFPALLNTMDTNFHIGNCNRENGQFTGLLKQLLLLPGADASAVACPSSQPNLPDLSQRPPTGNHLPTAPSPPFEDLSRCTWLDTGKIWYDIYRQTLNVCYSGIWQPVLLPPDERVEKRLDYIVWHQDIVTAAPTIDLEIFRIPEEGLFMATASFSEASSLRKQQSAIFKWQQGRFKVYQSLYTLGAQGWEHFQIGKQFFLAVANHGPRRERPFKSVIYRWSRKRKQFRVHQELVTWTARDLEHFEIQGTHYLAVANHVKGRNHSIESIVYRWNDMTRKFTAVQEITTVGAYDWTHFRLDEYHFLAVANSFSGPPLETTKLDSVIYFWQNGTFVQFQTLETTGATDWEFFAVKDDYYLVVANAFNFGGHTTGTERYKTNSTIYRLNKLRKQFEIYQEIVTYNAVDWESFTVGDDTYLIVSNAQQDVPVATPGLPLERTRSIIYRWQGVEKFVAKHYLDTLPSADWEVFTVNGHVFLAYANAEDNISQIYKVKFV